MQNGEHIIVLYNYLKSIAVFKMGYRMAVTFFRKNATCIRLLKAFSCFCFQILYHKNNSLKILIFHDLSSTDTLLNLLKMEFKMAAF